MGFLAPWFLAGALAVGLPIYVHLLRQHESPKLAFSSLMFFERHVQSSIKYRRLRYLLLFALRTALLLLLVLAFADPFVKRQGAAGGAGRKLVVLAIDNSFSMRAEDRLGRAKREAGALLATWAPENQGLVLAFGSSVQLMTQPVADIAALRGAVQAITQSDSRSSFAELARGLRSVAQASQLPLEVHFFSDMQKSSAPVSLADWQLPENAKFIVHAATAASEPNWAVESVSAPRRVQDPKKARVQATIAGFGTPAAERRVSLVVNGRVAETKAVTVPLNGRATVEFLTLEVPYGLTRCEVRIDPADKLPGDDQFYFSVDRSDPRRVLLVHESRHPRALTYFRSAMEASPDGAFQVEALGAEQTAHVKPSNYAAVVVSDAGSLPPTFIESLGAYVRGGGGVLIAVGPSAALRPRVPLFDEAIAEARHVPASGQRFQAASNVDAGHPMLERVNKLENVRFYQTSRIDPGSARILARLDDLTPLLMEKKIGEGRVLVFASTFDNISNDFPLHAAFVPFVEQTAAYLAGQAARPPAYPVDSYIELRSAKEQGIAVEALDPDGARALSLAEAATASTLQLARQGYYSIRAASGRQELAAVNADRRESDLEVLAAETTALWQNTSQDPLAAGQTGEAAPFRLWWYVILGAILVAVVETWIGSRYLEGRAGAS